MKHVAFGFAMVCAGCGAIFGGASKNASVSATALNLRTAPTVTSNAIDVLPRGTEMHVIDRSGDWVRGTVTRRGETVEGWVNGRFLTATGVPARPSQPDGLPKVPELKQSASEAEAAQRFRVTASRLNMRTGPGLDNRVRAVLARGTSVELLERSQGWIRAQVSYKGRRIVGWVSDRYVQEIKPVVVRRPAIFTAQLTPTDTPQVEASFLNFRAGPTTQSEVIGVLTRGTPVTIIGRDGNWLQARAIGADGVQQTGWLASRFVAEPSTRSTAVITRTAPSATAAPVAPAAAETTATDLAAIPVPEATETPEASDTASLAVAPPTVPKQTAPSTSEDLSAGLAPVEPFKELDQEPDRVQPAPISARVSNAPVTPVNPVTFAARDFSCRNGYFQNTFEACSADIRIDVQLADGDDRATAATVPVQCRVDFEYEAGGTAERETVIRNASVPMRNGQGSAVVEARIDFLFRVDNVTRVSLTELNCTDGGN
ncbi:MAG: SH3 domain-containing protein [Pseudomonadota bacterium]